MHGNCSAGFASDFAKIGRRTGILAQLVEGIAPVQKCGVVSLVQFDGATNKPQSRTGRVSALQPLTLPVGLLRFLKIGRCYRPRGWQEEAQDSYRSWGLWINASRFSCRLLT